MLSDVVKTMLNNILCAGAQAASVVEEQPAQKDSGRVSVWIANVP